MKTYTVYAIGMVRDAESGSDAVDIARNLLGAAILYRGSVYRSDELGGTVTDLWESRKAASQQSGNPADAIVVERVTV